MFETSLNFSVIANSFKDTKDAKLICRKILGILVFRGSLTEQENKQSIKPPAMDYLEEKTSTNQFSFDLHTVSLCRQTLPAADNTFRFSYKLSGLYNLAELLSCL